MQSNLNLLESLDNLIEELDRRTAILLRETPGVYLLSIQGISTIRVAEFIAEIGNPYKYRQPGELWIDSINEALNYEISVFINLPISSVISIASFACF